MVNVRHEGVLGKRGRQAALIGSFVYLSWLGMMIVHECGHVLGAWCTGGVVDYVLLHPLLVSRTDVFINPHPLLEVWAGAVFGSLFPLVVYLIARVCRMPGLYLLKFFAGFCLIANGVYLAEGAFFEVADAGELLVYGAARWHLVLFGLLTVPPGFYLWNGLGPNFGLGAAKGEVSRSATFVSVGLLTAVVFTEVLTYHMFK